MNCAWSLVVLGLVGCANHASVRSTHSEPTREVVTTYLNKAFGDPVVYDQVVAEDYVLHFVGQERTVTGRTNAKKWLRAQLFAGLPDVTQQVEFLIVDGDRAAARVRYTGTHSGTFAGLPATGRRISVPANMLLRVEDGRIAEEWTESNQVEWMRQLQAD